MKIDEASINHNALRLIENEADRVWNITDRKKGKEAVESVAYINGVAMMAKYMKEVLKS